MQTKFFRKPTHSLSSNLDQQTVRSRRILPSTQPVRLQTLYNMDWENNEQPQGGGG